MAFKDVAQTRRALGTAGYIATTEIATVVFLAAATEKPVLVAGAGSLHEAVDAIAAQADAFFSERFFSNC